MSATAIHHDLRSLAQIESDLIKAEETFADADARCKEAERERLEAFDKLNVHQAELDDAIARLRQRSIPGSKWRPEAETAAAAPILELDTAADAEPAWSVSGAVEVAVDDSPRNGAGHARISSRFAGYDPFASPADNMSAEEITSKFFHQPANGAADLPVPGFEFRNFAPVARS